MERKTLPIGLGDERVPLGAHIAYWYRTPEEKFETLGAYLTAGVQEGQLCMCGLPEEEVEAFKATLKPGMAVAAEQGRLQIYASDDFYFKNKRFHPDRLIASYPELVRKAKADGFPSIRAAGEIPWRMLAQLSMPNFFHYEERINADFFDLFPVIGLCLFDMNRFGTEWTLGILRTHPVMLAGGRSFQNPSYYQT